MSRLVAAISGPPFPTFLLFYPVSLIGKPDHKIPAEKTYPPGYFNAHPASICISRNIIPTWLFLSMGYVSLNHGLPFVNLKMHS